jgi:hypothetical protein
MSGPFSPDMYPPGERTRQDITRALIYQAEGIMALHRPSLDGTCARCARVGLDHKWPCGPYELGSEIVHGAGRHPVGILLQDRRGRAELTGE